MNRAVITIGISALLSGCLATTGSSDTTNWQSNPPLRKFTEVPSNGPIESNQNSRQSTNQSIQIQSKQQRDEIYSQAYDAWFECSETYTASIPWLFTQPNAQTAYQNILNICKKERYALEESLVNLPGATNPEYKKYAVQAASEAMVELLLDTRKRVGELYNLIQRLPGATASQKLSNRLDHWITEYVTCVSDGIDRNYNKSGSVDTVASFIMQSCNEFEGKIARARYDEELYKHFRSGNRQLLYRASDAMSEAKIITENMRRTTIELVNEQRSGDQKYDNRKLVPNQNNKKGVMI